MKTKHYSTQSIPISHTERMMHYCAHCDYKSIYRANVVRHQSRKHKLLKEEVVQYQPPLLHQKQPTDWQLMEDSIQVFKIYKLLQRMKNKN